MLEHVHDTKPELALVSTQITANQACAIHDMAGFRSIYWAIYPSVVATADGSNYFTPLIEESDDSGMANQVAIIAPRLLGTVAVINATAQATTMMWMGAVVHKRYVRFTYTKTAGSPDATITVFAIKGRPRHAPTS